jgi:1D-myo-inositol 3-kinase
MDYLAIGHVTIDLLRSGPTVGGSVSYAALAATRLGCRAAVLTSAGDEVDWPSLLPGVEIHRLPSPSTTRFENRYVAGNRQQRLLGMAAEIQPGDVPAPWLHSAIVHLAPVVHEVGPHFSRLFAASLVGLTPQGLLREWDGDGQVRQGKWQEDGAVLSGCRVVIFSEEELAGDPDFLSICRKRVPITLLTRGARGATLFLGSQLRDFPAYPVEEVDPTGAGDVFAAAFLIEYHRTGDPAAAAAFACCAASFAVERPGTEGMPTRSMVERRLHDYRY